MSSTGTINKRFFIIDGYALLFRAHFALIRNPLITTYGLNTSALFGFTNQIFKILREEKPDYFACAFDSRGKTFRHKIYEEYKANRPKMPDELQLQLPHLWEILEAMNIPVLKKKGYEADDIIGTLANYAQSKNLLTYIVSGDKDFMQLINDKIFLYAPGTKSKPNSIIYDSNKVKERWGVYPDKIIDLLGLMGDSSDNVPGVSGVGEKTAVKLIEEFGSLENALENANKVKNKRARDGLLNGFINAKLSKELVTIILNVKINHDLKDFLFKDMDSESCIKKFNSLEFYGLVKQLQSNNLPSKKKTANSKKNYKIVSSLTQLDELMLDISESALLSFNIEVTNLDPINSDILGISFTIKKNQSWYLPMRYTNKEQRKYLDCDLKVIIDKLKKIFEDKSIKKTGHNIKFDTKVLKIIGINIKGIVFDNMIAAHLLNPSAKSISLHTLTSEYLNIDIKKIDELIGRGKNQLSISQISIEEAANYSSERSDSIFKLTSILKPKLKDNSLFEILRTIELPLSQVLANMEYLGVYVDSKMLMTMSERVGIKLNKLKKEIFAETGHEFNINSTQQLAKVLFDDLELDKIKKRSTAEDVLKKLCSQHILPKYLLEYRKYNKLKNTYLDSLQGLINPNTNRIHSTFNQTITSTGRLSSKNPNFQNIPIRRDEGKDIRKSFISDKANWKILSADYSQVELRIMAHYSQDSTLIKAFQNDEDIHSRTASLVYNVPFNMVVPEMRRTAKVVNFGIMYGAGPYRMSQELGVSRNEATLLIENYFNKYPGIQSYIDLTLSQARNYKFVETLLGRKRPILDANSDNGIIRKAAERMAINMPIQGSAAEMIKLAMINIQKKINKARLKSKLVLQIHDELLFEFPIEEKKELIKLVVGEMENAVKLSVPLKVDYGVGQSWFEAH